MKRPRFIVWSLLLFCHGQRLSWSPLFAERVLSNLSNPSLPLRMSGGHVRSFLKMRLQRKNVCKDHEIVAWKYQPLKGQGIQKECLPFVPS